MNDALDFLSEKHPVSTGVVGTSNGILLWFAAHLGAINGGLDMLLRVLSVVSIVLTILVLHRRLRRDARHEAEHRANDRFIRRRDEPFDEGNDGLS